jgi:hypothetical protein
MPTCSPTQPAYENATLCLISVSSLSFTCVGVLICFTTVMSATHLPPQHMEVVCWCGAVNDLPVCVLDLCAQVAACEPLTAVNLLNLRPSVLQQQQQQQQHKRQRKGTCVRCRACLFAQHISLAQDKGRDAERLGGIATNVTAVQYSPILIMDCQCNMPSCPVICCAATCLTHRTLFA